MFEKTLEEKFKSIFQVDKVTYDSWDPKDESIREQKCLFIEITSCLPTFSDKVQKALVVGKATMVARNAEFPYGFFGKAIDNAADSLTKDLFFYDFEENQPRFRDVSVRGFSFQYFFNSQYDPDLGTIESVELTVEEEGET